METCVTIRYLVLRCRRVKTINMPSSAFLLKGSILNIISSYFWMLWWGLLSWLISCRGWEVPSTEDQLPLSPLLPPNSRLFREEFRLKLLSNLKLLDAAASLAKPLSKEELFVLKFELHVTELCDWEHWFQVWLLPYLWALKQLLHHVFCCLNLYVNICQKALAAMDLDILPFAEIH